MLFISSPALDEQATQVDLWVWILRRLMFCLVSHSKFRRIMATLADVTTSLASLTAVVSTVSAEVATLKAAQGAATAADLDGVKASVDAAVAALSGL